MNRAALRLFVLVLTALLLVLGAPLAGSAAAAGQCAAPTGVYRGPTPWAQNLLDAPRAWSVSNGSGVEVAVLGTGVDPGNAQFSAGQVLPEIDLLANGPAAPDCDGQGTFAAGLVAAQAVPGTNFAGLAPGARILPVRYVASSSPPDGADPDQLATAIDKAVAAGAGVILIMVPASTDSNALQLAVQNALGAGDVIIAPAVGDQPSATSYPTATPGVLAVGALGQTGEPVQAEAGSYLALSAPSANLVGLAPGARGGVGESWPVTGPGYAAAYVAGAVALLRSYRPSLDPAQVSTRLILTATHAGNGGHDPQLGWGVLDPFAALTANLPANAVAPTIGSAPRAAPRTQAPASGSSFSAGVVGLLVLLGVGLVGIVVAVLTARRRGWRVRTDR